MRVPLLPFPKRINVELTNYCNQRCPLCPRQELSRPLGFMAREVFERIALECAGQETLLWLHFLGEPLLHRHATALITLAKAVGCRVGLSTNAASLGTHADALLDSGLDRLECSLDALDRAGYEAMRGRDHFDRVTRNVRDFLSRKQARGSDTPITSLQFMRTAAVDASLSQIVDTWESLLGPQDFIMTIEPISFRNAVRLDDRRSPACERTARPACPWLFEAVVIMQDGTVTMCGADWDASAPLGNVGTATLTDIWTGAEANRRRAAHLDGRFEAVGPCATCEDWRLADGHGYVNALEEVRRKRKAAATHKPSGVPSAPSELPG